MEQNEARQGANGHLQDYTEYCNVCHTRAGQTPFFAKRGISAATIERYNLGYDPAWRPPEHPDAPTIERAIIPTGGGGYAAYLIGKELPKAWRATYIGERAFFNMAALHDEAHPYIFIVESELDALSLIEAGGQAVAMGTPDYARTLAELIIEAAPVFAGIVLSLGGGNWQRAQEYIIQYLSERGISVFEANLAGGYDDVNEAFLSNRERIDGFIKDPRKAAYVEKNSVKSQLPSIIRRIEEGATAQAVSTGFDVLDAALDGGLYEGLYIFGALSSIGKTTACLQIADQVAHCDHDVIFFSLEMSTDELISKSISRLTFKANKEKNDNGVYYARTGRQIQKVESYNDIERRLIAAAWAEYAGYCGALYIHEGVGDIGAEQIKGIVKEHIYSTGRRPIVVIDYLQILAPYEMRATDKQNTDKAVLELKRMSREHRIPVLAISSFNRDNYNAPVNMAAFKESGAIEYSSDVLLGLQFEGMDELSSKKGESALKVDELKQATPRKVELKILKNRSGATGARVYFDYYPQFNYFKERIDVNGI